MASQRPDERTYRLSFHDNLHESVLKLIESCRHSSGVETQVEGELVLRQTTTSPPPCTTAPGVHAGPHR